MGRALLWPELEPAAIEVGWIAEPLPIKVTASMVLDAIALRHDMSGIGGRPARWVFCREVQAMTGAYSNVQRFDAVAIGLVPSVKYARVVYEVKVSRSDWLHELKPITDVRYGGHRLSGYMTPKTEEEVADLVGLGYKVETRNKWDEAFAISTEFYVAAPPHVVQESELPPGAGLVEVRPWGTGRTLKPRVVRAAQVRETPQPGPEFYASFLRRALEERRDGETRRDMGTAKPIQVQPDRSGCRCEMNAGDNPRCYFHGLEHGRVIIPEIRTVVRG